MAHSTGCYGNQHRSPLLPHFGQVVIFDMSKAQILVEMNLKFKIKFVKLSKK